MKTFCRNPFFLRYFQTQGGWQISQDFIQHMQNAPREYFTK